MISQARRVLLCLAVSLSALPQTPAQRVSPRAAEQEQQEVKAEDKCTLEGSVVNAQTGEPLKKVQILLFKMGARGESSGTTTDSGGRFKLTNIDPGRYNLWAERNGFAREPAGRRPSVLTLAPGQAMRNVDLRLVPAAVVTGRVLDEDGEPLARARIQALRYRYVQGRRRLLPTESGSTDDLGRYRLFGLNAGRYYISATYREQRYAMGLTARPAGDSSAESSDEGYAPVYYPDALEPSQAVAIQLRPGEERAAVDFNLRPVRSVRVRGRVVNPAPSRAGRRDPAVTLAPRDPGNFGYRERTFGRVDRNGDFELRGVTPGSYTLIAFSESEGNRLTARTPVEVGNSNVEGIELTLRPGVELKGAVRVEAGTEAKVEMEELRVYLRSMDLTMFGGPSDGAVDADGFFALKDVAEGDYQLSVPRMPPGFYLKAAKLGDADVLGKDLSITEASAGAALELVLSPNGGNIDGAVLDDEQKPAAGAAVVLVPESEQRSRADLYRNAPTDQYGRFSFGGVPPGEYRLFAWADIEPGAWQDPELLKQHEDKGKEVSVEEKSQQTIELRLIQATDAAQ